jgi:2-hydroxy-6-oxonona-2,4-dienedioate hydrolase
MKVRGLSMPTMVVAGREDETGPWNKSLPLVDMVADVEFHVLPFCGHFPQYDQPAALTALMTEFLARKGTPIAATAR